MSWHQMMQKLPLIGTKFLNRDLNKNHRHGFGVFAQAMDFEQARLGLPRYTGRTSCTIEPY